MNRQTFPIVGAYYRPPAKAILEVLASGAQLILRPEPDNPSDPNAIQVIVHGRTLAALSDKAKEALAEVLPLWGCTLDEALACEEIHLGFIPRTHSAAVAQQLHGASALGALCFAATGQPQVTSDLSRIDEATGELID